MQRFDPSTVQDRYQSPAVASLEAAIDRALTAAFGENTTDYHRYDSARRLDQGPHVLRTAPEFGGPIRDDPREFHPYFEQGKRQSIALLEEAVRQLEEEIEDAQSAVAPSLHRPTAALQRTIFIVHGHNAGPKEAVARFLERIGFRPIILHEQPSQSRTIIEKIEAHADVGFAVVLLTPDDQGHAIGEAPRPRARQNVILELGLFLGKLGRSRVCTLVLDEVEIPSDWSGVIGEPYDPGGAWQTRLAKELQAAGYQIDWNLVMR